MDKSNPNAFLQLIGFWKKTIYYYVVFKRILIDLAAYLNTMIEQKKVESAQHIPQCGKMRNSLAHKKYSVVSTNFFNKNVAFMKFLSKILVSKLNFHTVYSLIGLLFVVVFEFYSITFKAANIFSKNCWHESLNAMFPIMI